MTLPFYTVGHQTRSLDEFVELLRAGQISLIADIRSVPRSRTNPQDDEDLLPAALAAGGRILPEGEVVYPAHPSPS